mgnify:CR=1 FL=1
MTFLIFILFIKNTLCNSSGVENAPLIYSLASSVNDKVNCFGPVCSFEQIETTCQTTYEYEYVKRNVSCPAGYEYISGTNIRAGAIANIALFAPGLFIILFTM